MLLAIDANMFSVYIIIESARCSLDFVLAMRESWSDQNHRADGGAHNKYKMDARQWANCSGIRFNYFI